MNRNERDGGMPAFPPTQYSDDYQMTGITVRDYFAAKALQGFMASPMWDHPVEKLAAWAYQQADAMLEARLK